MPGPFTPIVPNYSQLGQVNPAAELRANAQLSNQIAQRASNDISQLQGMLQTKRINEFKERAMQQDAQNAQLNFMAKQSEVQRKALEAGGKELRDSMINIYGASGGDPEKLLGELKSRTQQILGPISPQAAVRAMAALDDPEQASAIVSDLKSAWGLKQKTAAGKGGSTRQNLSKDVRIFAHPDKPDDRRRFRLIKEGPGAGMYVEEGTTKLVNPQALGLKDITSDVELEYETKKAMVDAKVDWYTKKKDEWSNQADAAVQDQAKIDTFEALRRKAATGFWAGTEDMISGVMELGDFENSERGVRQALRSITMDFAEMRFGKTKGSISDTEFKAFLAVSPNVGMTPEGLTVMLNLRSQYNDWVRNRNDFIGSTLNATNMSRDQMQAALDAWDRLNSPFDPKLLERAIEIGKSDESLRSVSVKSLWDRMQGTTGASNNADGRGPGLLDLEASSKQKLRSLGGGL